DVARVAATLDEVVFFLTPDACFRAVFAGDDGVAFFILVSEDRFLSAGDFDEAFFAAMGVPWSGLFQRSGPARVPPRVPSCPNVPRRVLRHYAPVTDHLPTAGVLPPIASTPRAP